MVQNEGGASPSCAEKANNKRSEGGTSVQFRESEVGRLLVLWSYYSRKDRVDLLGGRRPRVEGMV